MEPAWLCVLIRKLLLCRLLGKLRRYQVLIWHPFRQFSGFLQDVLQQLKAVFLKDQVLFPGVLGFVAVHDHGDIFQRRFGELGLDGLGDLLGGVGVDVVHTLLDGVGEFLDHIRMLLQIAFLGAVGGVGHVAGVGAQGGDYIALAFQLQRGGERLKLNSIILNTALML